ncbi:MAG TPA: HEAT repeat domain-containing protein [Anaerolineales bacterium]|nr:HEAT repeat domain-containing protein [Anaerolineales bacterium]
MGEYRVRRSACPATGTKINPLNTLIKDLISGNDALAETAMNELVALGEAVFPALEELLESSDADHRWWALSVLAQIEGANIDWMLAGLNDESDEVRQCAALGLSVHPNDKSIPALIKSLYDSDPMVATLSSNALAKIGESAVLPLLSVLDDNETGKKTLQIKSAHLGAMRALASIADPRAIPAMMTALEENDSVFMKHWAEVGLKELGQEMVYFKTD